MAFKRITLGCWGGERWKQGHQSKIFVAIQMRDDGASYQSGRSRDGGNRQILDIF